jgi:hypothetical protein
MTGSTKSDNETNNSNTTLFNPSSLNDEIAMNTEWNPKRRGGRNHGTHRLKEISMARVEFKISGMGILIPMLFVVVGIAVMVGATVGGIILSKDVLYLGILFGGLSVLTGYLMLRNWTTPRVFDRNNGHYWIGRKEPDIQQTGYSKDSCLLNEIHAIQILPEICRNMSGGQSGKSTLYYSYELNLVLQNGRRMNVIDHSNLHQMRFDSEILSQFLGIPVWDTTQAGLSHSREK